MTREQDILDRKAIATAMAKALAYAACGKPVERDQWARELVKLLGARGILAVEG